MKRGWSRLAGIGAGFEYQGEHESQWAAIGSIAGKIGCRDRRVLKVFERYYFKMQIASGTIVGGKVVVEGLSLPADRVPHF